MPAGGQPQLTKSLLLPTHSFLRQLMSLLGGQHFICPTLDSDESISLITVITDAVAWHAEETRVALKTNSYFVFGFFLNTLMHRPFYTNFRQQ